MVRKIHQTWIGEVDQFPYKKWWLESWKKGNPGWGYRLWDTESCRNLVERKYPWLLKSYDKVDKNVIRSDMARYAILHSEGGLYVDMDFICLKPMEELLTRVPRNYAAISSANPSQPYSNAFLYAPQPGHVLFKRSLVAADRSIQRGVKKVEDVAGPGAIRSVIENGVPHMTMLDAALVFPFQWGSDEHDAKARKHGWEDIEKLRKAYPQAFAVTHHSHHW